MSATFDDLGLIGPLLAALAELGHVAPTPIQAQALPALLAGRDLCASAPTGSGKTAAFALPILQRLATRPGLQHLATRPGLQHLATRPGLQRLATRPGLQRLATRPGTGVRALVLAPTRELAVQIDAAFGLYGRHLPQLRHAVVYGGMKLRAQRRALEEGVDVLIATPGRLLDLCGQGAVHLDGVECFVLDEADRMLDLGFQQDLRAIVKRLPPRRQTLLFSATLPADIVKLAAGLLHDPASVIVAPVAHAAEHVTQIVFLVEKPDKRAQLMRILADPDVSRALVFIRTRDAADRLARALRGADVRAEALHADRPQVERERALADFQQGLVRVLVATDIAARGLHVDGVSHVVNVDVPSVPETYLHRIGRTARAGAPGVAITLCAKEERPWLAEIERALGRSLMG